MEITHAQYLAQKINGMEYGNKLSADDLAMAKANGLVIVTGYSDDNLEFEGAFTEEIGANDGVVVMADEKGIIMGDEEGCEHCTELQRGKDAPYQIDAQWSKNDYSWYIETNIPNAAYFDVLEDKEKFCRGVVFALADLQPLPVAKTDDDLKVIERMQMYGGSFVQSLSIAAQRADAANLTKLKTTFADYWKQYAEMTDNEPTAA